MKFALTFGQKYNDPETDHATLGQDVTGHSYLVVVADDEIAARQAVNQALPWGDTGAGDYAFMYEFDADFLRQIEQYDLVPIARSLIVETDGEWEWLDYSLA
jgi:hypothetical protein